MDESGRSLFEDTIWHPHLAPDCTVLLCKYHIQCIPCYSTQVKHKGEIREALVGKSEGRRSRLTWEDNIKTDITEIWLRRLNYVIWFKAGKDNVRGVVETVMNSRVS
jgi:hypothetical protein